MLLFLLLLGFYPSLLCINTLSSGCSLNNLARHLLMEGPAVCGGMPEERTCLILRYMSLIQSRHRQPPGTPTAAMHRYSLASHCDKSYYAGEKYPSHCAKPPTAQNNPDLFPQQSATLSIELKNCMLTNHLSYHIIELF